MGKIVEERMKNMKRIYSIVVLTCVLLVACDSKEEAESTEMPEGGEAPDTSNPSDGALEADLQQIAQSSIPGASESLMYKAVFAACKRAQQCGPQTGLEDETFRAPFDDRPEVCADALYLVLRIDKYEEELQESIASGALEYSMESFDQCLSRYIGCEPFGSDGLPFSSETALQTECLGALVGQLAESADCHLDLSCKDGLYCDFGENQCPGTCRSQVAAGEACEDDQQCLHAFGELGRCEGGTCVVRSIVLPSAAGEGETCGSNITQDEVAFTQCEDGLYCKSGPSCPGGFFGLFCQDSPTCEKPTARGEPCRTFVDVCAKGSFCLENEGSSNDGVCVDRTEVFATIPDDFRYREELFVLSEGESCETDAEREAREEQDGVQRGLLLDGSQRTCKADLFCDQDTGVCRKRLPAGEVCSEANRNAGCEQVCESRSFNGETGVCTTDFCAE